MALCLAAFAIATALTSTAQTSSILDQITVELPTKLITAKGTSANVRTRPSTNAPIVKVNKDDYSYNLTLPYYQCWAVLDEENGWYKTEYGYVSKSVTKEVPLDPVPNNMINQASIGYEEGEDATGYWRVGRNKATGLVLCEISDNPRNALLIGKEINGVFVFKYAVENLYLNYIETESKPSVQKDKSDDYIQYTLTYGPNLKKNVTNPDNPSEPLEFIDLNRIPKDVLEYLFKEAIQKNEVKNFYVPAYMMTPSNKFFYPFN